jgi:predicted XRE-type DNA-binding protein
LIWPSGGDVFRDLGFSVSEAEDLRIRSEMMNPLIAQIEKRKLTQSRAAKLLGVTQPRVSDLTGVLNAA